MGGVTISVLRELFGSDLVYLAGVAAMGLGVGYIAYQVFRMHDLSLDMARKKLDGVRDFLAAKESGNDLMIEEAFFRSYRFPLRLGEINFVLARRHQRDLVLALQRGKTLLEFDELGDSYSYVGRVSLPVRRHLHATIYFASAFLVYFVLLAAVVDRSPALLMFAVLFFFVAWVALRSYGCARSAEAILDPLKFPRKETFPKIQGIGAPTEASQYDGSPDER